ncbi:MAG TPA: enoyl-CoA hydratase/isomerase family protein [Bacteroidales bacterium]|nr:enoyl-CoA hydratase/isomerase family protein [Bacteroidales bacterium]
MFSSINWHIKNKIGFLELNNPPSNAMSSTFFDEFYQWRNKVVHKSKIKSIIIKGKGRHFSSGAIVEDLVHTIQKSQKQSGNINKVSTVLNQHSQLFLSLKDLEIPVISAVRGVCLGSAFELALCADYVLCADKAVLGLPESTFGLIPGCTGTYILPKITTKALAMELILTGKTFSAEQALRWNLIHQVVPTKQLMEKAIEVAYRLKNNFHIDLKKI